MSLGCLCGFQLGMLYNLRIVNGILSQALGNAMDIVKLEEYYPGDVTEILHSFLGESQSLISNLENDIGKQDCQAISFNAHQLKGLAKVIFAEDLAKEAAELELGGRTGDFDHALKHWKGLVQAFEATVAEVTRELTK